jgi:glycerol-3-phosphate dehydrogenase
LPQLFPDIESEVRYAVRNEYAQTAIDVIARRTRLAFLNAQAAFDALPRIVDIMSEELGWSYWHRQVQIAAAVKFLGSMGLPPSLVNPLNPLETIPKSWIDEVERFLWKSRSGLSSLVRWGGVLQKVDHTDTFTPSRSRFEGGEVIALRNAFTARTRVSNGVEKVVIGDILDILKGISGYADITKKELEYVLDEAGMQEGEVNFDELIEVREFPQIYSLVIYYSIQICGNLKEVSFTPSPTRHKSRLRIPVEKSGGGV